KPYLYLFIDIYFLKYRILSRVYTRHAFLITIRTRVEECNAVAAVPRGAKTERLPDNTKRLPCRPEDLG
ncbi:hypothetical protein TSAR_014621, partial [Trichomalopsis sarcophagae]